MFTVLTREAASSYGSLRLAPELSRLRLWLMEESMLGLTTETFTALMHTLATFSGRLMLAATLKPSFLLLC